MATRLTGLALSTLAGAADHTYVEGSTGELWGCWGRSAGGRPICHGPGSVEQAECLSNPASKAGIRYGRTGVCHQTANRILLPANLTVARARGYRKSLFLFGAYGLEPGTINRYHPTLNPWPELRQCRLAHQHS